MPKAKAIEVTQKDMINLCTRKVDYFREALNKGTGYKPGLGSYVLYGLNHARGLTEVIASEATAADFSKHLQKSFLSKCVDTYDHVLSYRNTGTGKNPNVQIRVWFKEYI